MTYNWSFTRITRRVQLVKQVLITLPDQLSSQPSFQLDSCCLILNFLYFFLSVTAFRFLFLLTIVCVVHRRITASDCVFGVFTLFWMGEKNPDRYNDLTGESRVNGYMSGNRNTSQIKTSTLVSGVSFMVRSKRLNHSKGPSWSWSYSSLIYNYLCN